MKYTLIVNKHGLFNTIFCSNETERINFAQKYLQLGYNVKYGNDSKDPGMELEEEEYEYDKSRKQ